MYHQETRHPLQSFRFWFLVLSCIAATSAWRMGWIPGSDDIGEIDEEIVLNEADNAPLFGPDAPFAAHDQIAGGQHEPATTAPIAQSEPAPGVESMMAAHRHPQESPFYPERATPPPSIAATPFGPRELEFQSADSVPDRSAPSSNNVANPATANPYEASPSGIQQVSAVEAVPDDTASMKVQNAFNRQFSPSKGTGFDWTEIDQMISVGQDVEAHRKLSTLYWENPGLRDQILPRVQQTSRRIYFQPQPHYLEPYVIEPGDKLQDISKQYRLSWQYLAKLNRMDPQRIRPGQTVKVMQGPFGAVVDLRRFELTVESFGYYVAHFPIGIGKDGTTPIGEFTVQDKLEDPTYYGPDGVIAHDDPNNPLGEFWLALGDSYGIHGTIDESTIGRAESRGCIRLRNQDIADLYDLLTVGSKVIIRR